MSFLSIAKFNILLFKQMKDLLRFPYFEIMLSISTFQLVGHPVHWGITFLQNLSDTGPLEHAAKGIIYTMYLSNTCGRVSILYPIIIFFSSLLSYLIISYFRDIGFLKTELSFPIKRSFIYLSKFLALYLTLAIAIFSSVLLVLVINCFNIFQLLDLGSISSGILLIFVETLFLSFFVSSVTTLIAFMVKWPGISFIISISLLYSFGHISSNFRIVPLFPGGLEIFENRTVSFSTEGIRLSFSPYSFEPLLPSLSISLAVFLLGHYYVTRRLQVS